MSTLDQTQFPFEVEQAITDAAPLVDAALAPGLVDGRDLLRAVAYIESRGDASAQGGSGELGLFQFMPSTWDDWGEGGDPFDPQQAARAAARFLAWLLGQVGGDWRAALAGYNAGIGRLTRTAAWPTAGWRERLPPVTRDYIALAERLLEPDDAQPAPVPVATRPRQPSSAGVGVAVALGLVVAVLAAS